MCLSMNRHFKSFKGTPVLYCIGDSHASFFGSSAKSVGDSGISYCTESG